jgi:O-antigen ligase
MAIIAAIVSLIVYEKPAIFFVTVFFINYVMFVDGGSYSTYMLLGTLCFFSPFFLFFKKTERMVPLLLPVFLVLCYYFIVLLMKPYTLNGYWILLHFEAMAIFAVTQFFTWDTEKIANVSKLHMIALAVFGIIEVMFFYKNRIRGPMMSSTAYGNLIVIAWATWFSYEFLRAKPQYLRIAVYTVLTITVMVATGTRMTMIGVAITFAATLFVRVFVFGQGSVNTKLIKLGVYGIMATLSVICVWTLLPHDMTIKKNFLSVLQGKLDTSSMGRLFVWFCAVRAFMSNPLLGIGNGNFKLFLQQNYENTFVPELFLNLPHAHNATLIILCENGMVGMVVILIIVGMAFLRFFKYARQPSTPRSAYCLVIGFAVMYILSMVDAIPYYPSSMAWIAWFLGA